MSLSTKSDLIPAEADLKFVNGFPRWTVRSVVAPAGDTFEQCDVVTMRADGVALKWSDWGDGEPIGIARRACRRGDFLRIDLT